MYIKSDQAENKKDRISRSLILAGAEGFEPPNGWTKTSCLAAWRRPTILNYIYYFI